MGYQIIYVTRHLDDFWARRADEEFKIFPELSDVLNHYARQGLDFVGLLPTEWRWLQESDRPHGPLETKGVQLDQLQIIFRERDDQ